MDEGKSPGLPVFLFPFYVLHVSMSPFSMPPFSVSMSLFSMFPEFGKQKSEVTENGNFSLFTANRTETENFCLFAENGNRKRKFVILSRQMINGNR
jgi:hypothetical protein